MRVRLTRVGGRKNPIWRVVVADQRSPRDGRVIEIVGRYNPQTEPSEVVLKRDRLQHWLDRGAQPTNTVRKLMRVPVSDEGGQPTADEAAAVPETEPERGAAPEEPAGDAAPKEAAGDAAPYEPSPAEDKGSG